MSENTVKVKPKGLLIPEPVLVAMVNMDIEDIGRMIRAMTEWQLGQDGPTAASERLSEGGMLVYAIWKAMLEESDAR